MLVLTRKPNQQIYIGDNIVINIAGVQGDNVRIAIDAPGDMKIYRGEIYTAIRQENTAAAATAALDVSSLPSPGHLS